MKHLKRYTKFVNEMHEMLEAVYIPPNVKEFAKRKGVMHIVKMVAGWAEKAGKRINGGTAIGKNYDTLILDLRHQGSEIRINLGSDDITLHGHAVTDAKSFKNALALSESIINEAAYKVPASDFGKSMWKYYQVKGEKTWRVHGEYAIDQVKGDNNPEERDVVFFEAFPAGNDIYVKIGGINNLKKSNASTAGKNFATTAEEFGEDPESVSSEAAKFLTDKDHLKWLNKNAKSEGQKIKFIMNDDYTEVIKTLINKALGQ
jgi:hypothetical protein